MNFVYIRDFFMKNFMYKLNGIKISNNYINNFFLCSILNFIPFFIMNYTFNLMGVKFLYQVDDIIYYSENNSNELGPVLLNMKTSNNNVTDIVEKYHNNVIVELIFLNENLEIDPLTYFYIKVLSCGTLKEANLVYTNIKKMTKVNMLRKAAETPKTDINKTNIKI